MEDDFRNRKPDFESGTFKTWAIKKKPKDGATLEVNFDKREQIYETISYNMPHRYSMFILSKERLKDGKIWVILKVKRPDKSTEFEGGPDKWITKEEYEKAVKFIEEKATFPLINKTVTPGWEYSIGIGISGKNGLEM